MTGFWSDVARAAGSALSEEPIPLKTLDQLPERTAPIIEIGPVFLGAGNISKGIELPTGAVWTPSLLIWGNMRSALQVYDTGNDRDPNCGKPRGGLNKSF